MKRTSKPKFNKDKARNVILYLLNKCGPMSEKKLMTMLYFCDMDYFERYENHFCGFTYYKTKDGLKIL